MKICALLGIKPNMIFITNKGIEIYTIPWENSRENDQKLVIYPEIYQ